MVKEPDRLVSIKVDSFNPETKITSNQAYQGDQALIVCASDAGCHTHISGQLTGNDLLSMMVALTDKVEEMLGSKFGFTGVDLPATIAQIRHEMFGSDEGQTYH